MARSTETPRTTTPKAPDLVAWHVVQKGEKAFWNKVEPAGSTRTRRG